MFDLVADVNSYPKFLPWCSAARIHSRNIIKKNEVLEADLVISFKVFREKFASKVILMRSESKIVTEYIDGPLNGCIQLGSLRLSRTVARSLFM